MSGQDPLGCWLAVVSNFGDRCGYRLQVVHDDRGHVLVARRGDTQAWDLPVGLLHRGEDVLAGVRRVVADSVTVGVSVEWLAGMHSQVRDGLTLVFPGAAQPVVH